MHVTLSLIVPTLVALVAGNAMPAPTAAPDPTLVARAGPTVCGHTNYGSLETVVPGTCGGAGAADPNLCEVDGTSYPCEEQV